MSGIRKAGNRGFYIGLIFFHLKNVRKNYKCCKLIFGYLGEKLIL